MSSTSSSHSRHDAAEASSSKALYGDASASQGIVDDSFSEQDVTEDLLVDDPLNDPPDEQSDQQAMILRKNRADYIPASLPSASKKRHRKVAVSCLPPFETMAQSLPSLDLVLPDNNAKIMNTDDAKALRLPLEPFYRT